MNNTPNPEFLVGVLVALGNDATTQIPRALVKCTVDQIRAVKQVPIMQSVAVVPLDQYQRDMIELRSLRTSVQPRAGT